MIPNLVEVVKQYAIHERETLERVVRARSMAMGAQTFEERTQNENVLSGALKSLFAISENYPQLKADGNFLNLQNQLVALEDEISQSRKYYNGVIKVMNNTVSYRLSWFWVSLISGQKISIISRYNHLIGIMRQQCKAGLVLLGLQMILKTV